MITFQIRDDTEYFVTWEEFTYLVDTEIPCGTLFFFCFSFVNVKCDKYWCLSSEFSCYSISSYSTSTLVHCRALLFITQVFLLLFDNYTRDLIYLVWKKLKDPSIFCLLNLITLQPLTEYYSLFLIKT